MRMTQRVRYFCQREVTERAVERVQAVPFVQVRQPDWQGWQAVPER